MKAAGVVPAAFFVRQSLLERFLMAKKRKVQVTQFWRKRGAGSKK
jgi:hypothetical protein